MNKKKRPLILLVLFLLTAGLFVCYLYLPDSRDSGENAPEEPIELYSLDTAQAVSLEFENEYGKVSLLKEEDTWYLVEDRDFPVDQAKIADMLAAVEQISADQFVTEEGDLKEYGLDSPQLTISVSLANEVTAGIRLGREVPAVGGYYALVDEANQIYVMNSSYFTKFNWKRNDLMLAEDPPEIGAANITELKIRDQEGKEWIAKEEESKVFTISGAYETPVKADSSALSGLFENYTMLTYGECAAYNCKDASSYGIRDDGAFIEISYYEEETKEEESAEDGSASQETAKIASTYRLQIGDEDGEGNYYVKPQDSTYVYRMMKEEVEGLLTVDSFSYVYPYIVSEELEDIRSITVESGRKETQFVLKEKTKTEEDGTESLKYECIKDGKPYDYDSFSEIYTKLTKLVFCGEIAPEMIKGDSIYAKIMIKGGGKNKEIGFHQYDDSQYYRVSVDGEMYFLIDKKQADETIQSMFAEK